MKQTDYEWMLFGCHPVSDVAMAYCSCEHTTSSTRAFRKLVKLYPRLYEAPLPVRIYRAHHYTGPFADSCHYPRVGDAGRSFS